MRTKIVAIAVAALGLSAGAVGLANAGPGDPPAQAAPTSTTTAPGDGPRRPGPGGGPLARAVHGNLIVRAQDGTFENVAFDRGTLTAVSDSSLTLQRPDGVDVTVKLDGDTRYRGVENAAALRKGEPAAVVSKDGTARVVMQRDPDAPARRPGEGRRRPGGPGGPAGAPAGFADDAGLGI